MLKVFRKELWLASKFCPILDESLWFFTPGISRNGRSPKVRVNSQGRFLASDSFKKWDETIIVNQHIESALAPKNQTKSLQSYEQSQVQLVRKTLEWKCQRHQIFRLHQPVTSSRLRQFPGTHKMTKRVGWAVCTSVSTFGMQDQWNPPTASLN